ncbi:GNAT family N-acetyltransferase [Sphaerisporangium viridialbum]|uniref:GNAT family N-acetyltransferase n=1 Tax=Sphaerisporangium viridialbum TaxID=46189 RepID=UPI003C78DD98
MSTYETMSFHLETERLILRPWAESDAAELRALHSERGNGTPTVEHTRTLIAKQLTATATTGIALLPIQRRDEGDFIGYCGLIIGRARLGAGAPRFDGSCGGVRDRGGSCWHSSYPCGSSSRSRCRPM